MIKKILLGVLIIIVVVSGYFYTRLDALVKGAVEAYGPRLTKTTVTLRAVHLSPFSGQGRISGLIVGPPEGFTQPVLSLGSVSLSIETKSVLSGVIVVRELTFDAPELHYERQRSGDNLTALERNVASAMPASAQKAQAQKPSQTQKIIIDRFAARGGKAYVDLYGVKAQVPLPDVSLEGIGAPNGVDPKAAAAAVLAALKRSAVSAAESSTVGKNARQGVGSVQKQLKGLRGLFKR